MSINTLVKKLWCTELYVVQTKLQNKAHKTILFTSKKNKMAKSSLSKAELAVLDALIADLKGENEIVEATGAEPLFIAAVARTALAAVKVTVKATPVVAQVTAVAIGANALADTEFSGQSKEAKEGLSLDKLIELRKKFN